MKCPYCGSENLEEIIPNPNSPEIQFIIPMFNTKTKEIIPGCGLTVNLVSCNSCHSILIHT